MSDLFLRLRKLGWAAVEAGFLLIALCLVLDIILGERADSFISGVASNATQFLQAQPPGVLVGTVLLVLVYLLVRARLRD
jgi:hypothetical protein